jgi:NADH-quinone oxidoreductase subunit J
MASLAVASAVGVVAFRNPVNSVIALLTSFFALATIYLLAGFQFIAAAQILVYAGAILVLFLFVIMLLNLAHEATHVELDLSLFARRKSTWAALVAGALLVLSLASILKTDVGIASEPPPTGYDTIEALAGAMFGRYILPFEAVSLLLLATTVAVVVLAKRERGSRPRSTSARATQRIRPSEPPKLGGEIAESRGAARRETTSVGGAP